MPFRESHHLRCPRCGDVALNEARSFGVIREGCPSCHGEWLRMPEVARQFEAHGIPRDARLVAPKRDAGPSLGCPEAACREPLHQVRLGDSAVVDLCTHHGVWFDHGELSVALARSAQLFQDEDRRAEPVPLSERATTLEWLVDVLEAALPRSP